jgi:hypothetical protein
MISFGFLLVPFILFSIIFILILLISGVWMTLFYMQPNRTRVKYKSFYQRKNSKQINSENFLDDDDMIVTNLPDIMDSKKFEQIKRMTLYPNIHHLKT